MSPYDLLHSTGQDLQLPRGKGHKRTSKPYTKVPHLTHTSIHIRKTATTSGSPYSFQIVLGFIYVCILLDDTFVVMSANYQVVQI